MNESEIEKNLDMYDCKNYRGIEEDREKVSYSIRQMKLLGINKEEGKQEIEKVGGQGEKADEKALSSVIAKKADFHAWI